MSTLFIQQIVWLSVGWIIFLVGTFLDYTLLYRGAIAIYIINVIFLVVVEVVGTVAYGAQRWINLGFFRYQPSETMKLAMIIVYARMLSDKNISGVGMGFKELALPTLLFLIPFGLVVKQPDLGTGLMLLAVAGSMLLFAKVRKSILIGAVMIAIAGAFVGWKFVLRDYQKNRVLTFLSPTTDPRGTGYNSIQSKIAVGSGKFIGKGFMKGSQSQLEFLPERHTDFIFSVLSEEHGFVGCMITLCLFFFLFITGVKIASQATDKFGALLVVGVMGYIFWHMFINVGMVIGVLPIVGVPLPLLSYGGTSMMTTMTGMAIVSSVGYRRYLF
jgi:rod shape determining protein RodA